VTLLYKLLILLGFDSLDKTKEKPRTPSAGALPESAAQLSAEVSPEAAAVGERWWDDELAAAWTTLQEMNQAEICDGVVEQDVLRKVMVPPVGYATLRNKITEELENREDQDGLMDHESRRPSKANAEESMRIGVIRKKPSIESLCQRLGITMSRMEWLHRLFESFLQPDENDPNAVPVCLYPECPAAIKKVQMRSLMKELRPNMEEVEFEMRFRRIDTDLSGAIEFDEFVYWVREDEVRVAGAAPLQKMSFAELAVVYSESVELIKYLYDRFQDQFPPDEKDDYPKNPRSLGKEQVRSLVNSLTPDMSDAEFETQFQMTTFSKKDTLEFDEFLEVLPLDELPDEIRDAHDPE
jgi:Ca2+-binding EF-hand superfamily protein